MQNEADSKEAALERVAQGIAAAQRPLYAYACMLLGSARDASDVLQESNLVLWRKAAEYDPARPFLAWAYGVVYRQTLAHREKQSRDRHVFNAAVLEKISGALAKRNDDLDLWTQALEACVQKLPTRHRAMIRLRYEEQLTLIAIAQKQSCSENAVKAVLYRIRTGLAQCIKYVLAETGS